MGFSSGPATAASSTARRSREEKLAGFHRDPTFEGTRVFRRSQGVDRAGCCLDPDSPNDAAIQTPPTEEKVSES